MERFFSKRNQVFLQDGLVIKQVSSPESALTESDFLRELYLAGVPVPQVLERQGNTLVLEYIPGETLPDFLVRMETSPHQTLLRDVAQNLCRWFQGFYQAVDDPNSGEIRGDVNGRNFIVCENRIVSVDFEERVFGSMEQDVGRLLAFIHTYNPAGTSIKQDFAHLFRHEMQKSLGLSQADINVQYWRERIAMRKRRGVG